MNDLKKNWFEIHSYYYLLYIESLSCSQKKIILKPVKFNSPAKLICSKASNPTTDINLFMATIFGCRPFTQRKLQSKCLRFFSSLSLNKERGAVKTPSRDIYDLFNHFLCPWKSLSGNREIMNK